MTISSRKKEIIQRASRLHLHTFCVPPLAALLLAGLAFAGPAADGQTVAHNTPSFASSAKLVGREDAAKTIEVSIWLKPHNQPELDALAGQLYNPASPNYRKFLNKSQFAARFAPTSTEVATVQQFFQNHRMRVVTVGPHNFFVRASGTVAQVESAFSVNLNYYKVDGKMVRANDRDPYIGGALAEVARAVSGLDTGQFEHPLVLRSAILPNSKGLKGAASPTASGMLPGQVAGQAAGAGVPDGFFTNECFDGVKKETYSTASAFGGPLPTGTFYGNHVNLPTSSSPGCGYTPPEIQAAYKLSALYAKGFDGKGQTIGIIDWCGSSTILNDANAFSKTFGLPALTKGVNFNIIYTPTPSYCIAAGQVEINLDVEWAHAIAPGANINLIVPPSANFQDIDQAEFLAIDGGLANVISGSYGAPEFLVSQSELNTGNLINEVAAVQGISANFSSGDGGDYALSTFQGIKTVSYPADTPFATAIGGTTLALHADNSIAWQDGWGNNEFDVASGGSVLDTPSGSFFNGGSGGGASMCAVQGPSGACISGFPKPAYQKNLPGKVRQVPDISWLADPFTGAAVYFTIPGVFPGVWEVVGGTSLAAPMFSALWAIANQEAGAPLGQAAPYVYSMPPSTVKDILPRTSKTNVTAVIQDAAGTKKYSAAQLAGISGPFIDALWDYGPVDGTLLVLTFGTDSSLTVTEGWDNVTGVGVPTGEAFADHFLYTPGTFVKSPTTVEP